MSQNLTTGSKKWQLIGKQKTKHQIQTQKFQDKKYNNNTNINNTNNRDIYYINIDKLTSMQQQIPINFDRTQSIQIGDKISQSVQKKGIIYESQQLPRDPYGLYNVITSQNNLQTASNNRSQIIQSISFHEEAKKYQDSSLIHELQNMKDSNAQINMNINKKQQNRIQQNTNNKKLNKNEKILNNIRKMALSLDLLKNTQKNILLQISMYQSTSVNSGSLFVNNHELEDYLMNQIKQIIMNNNKRNSNNLLMSKSRQTLNQSFMKGLNESMQILQTSQKELKNGKIIQKLMKSLQQNQKLTVELRKKLTLKELDNKKLLKEVTNLRQKNIELISQKQQLLEEIFTLQQQIVGVQLQIQQKVKQVMSEMQPNYQNKKQKSINNNNNNASVYLSTIQQLSNQITVLNEKCSKYQKFIIEKQNFNDFTSKQGFDQMKMKIQQQLQAKQRYLTEIQKQLSFRDKKIKDYQIQLNSFARQIDQQKEIIAQKQEQLNQYNLELNQRQENIYNWQRSLEEQNRDLHINISQFNREKHLYNKQVSNKNKNVSFSPQFGEKALKKIDQCLRQAPVFQRHEQNGQQLELDFNRIHEKQKNYKNAYKNYELNYDPKSSNQHKKSTSSYSRGGGNVILTDNQDNRSAYYENQYDNEGQNKKKYYNYLNRNNKVILRHKNIVQNKQKSYSNLYSSNIDNKKSELVDDILARRRKQINKLVDNKRTTKNNLLVQGVFTQSEMNKIKSTVNQNYKVSNNRSSFNLSNYNEEKQKFQSRKVYEMQQRNYQERPKVNKFSKDISSILNKTNTNYQKGNYKKFDKKGSGLDNINDKLQKLKQEIKKQVKALQ